MNPPRPTSRVQNEPCNKCYGPRKRDCTLTQYAGWNLIGTCSFIFLDRGQKLFRNSQSKGQEVSQFKTVCTSRSLTPDGESEDAKVKQSSVLTNCKHLKANVIVKKAKSIRDQQRTVLEALIHLYVEQNHPGFVPKLHFIGFTAIAIISVDVIGLPEILLSKNSSCKAPSAAERGGSSDDLSHSSVS